jgi:cytochrome P450
VQARGLAVAGVIGKFLNQRPYDMFAELLAQDPAKMPIFKPDFGPVLIFRHPHVIQGFLANESLTVDPYAPQMRRRTEGENDPKKPDYFILGTDDPSKYRPDARILRYVMGPQDSVKQRNLIRLAVQRIMKATKVHSPGEIDVVKTIARYVPVAVAGDILGILAYEETKVCFDGVLKGGQTFDIDPTLAANITFKYIQKGKIPTHYDLYNWVKNSFRNIFNNLTRNETFERDGLESTEYLYAYIQKSLLFYKNAIQNGVNVPSNMLTKLLKLQKGVTDGSIDPSTLGFASSEELLACLTDARIRECVNGTVVGAIANPEEATARIIDGLLDFKDGKIKTAPDGGVTFDDAVKWAEENEAEHGITDKNMDKINRLAIELLRIYPQGEVVIRKCVKPINIGGVDINPVFNGTVFICHGSAMRDPDVVKNPLDVDITRDMLFTKYTDADDARPDERDQSALYLHHGFGRHKCLGRYPSEITMEESLRGILLLKNITRASPLEMDAAQLYAEKLVIKYHN